MSASLVAIPSITRISDKGNACLLPTVVNVSQQPCVSTPLKASQPRHQSHQDPEQHMHTSRTVRENVQSLLTVYLQTCEVALIQLLAILRRLQVCPGSKACFRPSAICCLEIRKGVAVLKTQQARRWPRTGMHCAGGHLGRLHQYKWQRHVLRGQ